MKPLRIVFVSSSLYGAPSLRALADSPDYRPVLVVSQPDRPAGRKLLLKPSPISELATELELPLYKPERLSDPESVEYLSGFNPDLIITASYGEIVGKKLRNLPRLGAINLHPSLLPLYRGATPIQSALLSGDEVTGISIFRLTARMDAGPIHRQITVPILPNENYSSLHDRLASLTARLLLDYLPQCAEGKLPEYEQNDKEASYTHKIEKQDQLISWHKPAWGILCLIRSLSQSPGAYQYYRDEMLKILSAELVPEPPSGEPGTVAELIRNKGFTVNCQDAKLLIKELQAPGKKLMDSWAWSLGSRIQPGEKLWK